MTLFPVPTLHPSAAIQPAVDRRTPAFWVRRITVVSELALGEKVIRDVALRRGLNIIWTPPQNASGSNELFQSGIAGHTAGKTTFCRLLRYALGEHGLATEPTRRKLRDRFPDGWVLAEVVIEDETWAVARPFGPRPAPFCIRGGSLESATQEAARSDYREFLAALTHAVVAPLPSETFPSNDDPVDWQHILPWLSRDQECRFSDFLEWRHGSSDADAPSLGAEDRQFLVRAVLGIISDPERVEQLKNTQLVMQKRGAAGRLPLLQHQAAADNARIDQLLPQGLDGASLPILALQTRESLRDRIAAVEQQLAELSSSPDLDGLRDALERAIRNEANARRDFEDATSRLRFEEGGLAALSPGVLGTSLLETLAPARGYCSQTMEFARENGCPLAKSRPYEIEGRRSEAVAATEAARQRDLIETLKTVVESRTQALSARVAETSLARRAEMGARTEREERRGQLLAEKARLEHVYRLAQDADAATQAAAAQTDLLIRLNSEIEASQSRQEAFRVDNAARLGQFSSTFDYVVRALLGNEVASSATLSGRSLRLAVDHHGERDSAAITTVKLLAFDLAAMTESIRGRGFFPRFLMHDGPREADLAADIYEKVFIYAQELEACFKDEPSFQYIVTTTTPPPSRLLSAPWHRLTISGIPTEQRLLMCDL